MSIPPLVCSTPPPPEQCEDDKDPEDFDLQYNLSQYEDDDGADYDFGTFNTYHQVQPTSLENHNKKNDIVSTVESVETQENEEISTNSSDAIDKPTVRLGHEEDINIEDLNLKVDENEPPGLNIKDDPGESTEQNIVTEITNIPNTNVKDNVNDSILPSSEIEDNPETSSLECIKNQVIVSEVANEDQSNFGNCNINQCDGISSDLEQIPESTYENPIRKLDVSSNSIEDFDDFDDFQFTSSNVPTESTKTDILKVSDNPWGNEDSINADFGDFTANFEDNNEQLKSNLDNQEHKTDCDDDDFGEFDDFKSSLNEIKHVEGHQEKLTCQQVPVLNLQSPDNESQVMESINEILSSIFQEDITETEEPFEGKLDLLLSETWGHLMETDVRQPYIVNWNNSLVQKSLLKALCIDSRNILFGPKWSYNTPKYAANLSVAPLQPQKQTTLSGNSSSEANGYEKVTAKTSTWTDPFASNGQEFTYAEALLLDLEHLMATLDQMAHNHSTLKISELLSHACSSETENAVIEPGPTDLDVFEATVSTKSDKIYSSTISVQPIRQINLPDTHIFTPTDSKTPRSKTIHYDCGPAPTVLIPQPVMDSFKSEPEILETSLADNVVTNKEDESEYWEFQDFKGKSDGSSQMPQKVEDTANTSLPNPAKTYQTQLLQPIKLEPIIPTLNWPDPGEVKETFEDFSDFVSNSVMNTDHDSPPNHNKSNSNVDFSSPVINISKDKSRVESPTSDNFDDEFDTFQSALPSNKNAYFDANFSSLDSKVPNSVQSMPQQTAMVDFDVDFAKSNNNKSDNISFTNSIKSSNILSQVVDSHLNVKDVNKTSSSGTFQGTNISILQPTASNTVGHTQPVNPTGMIQQNTAQILQPLSLESYSQINWPNPGIDLQDLSRFNPVETLPSLNKTDTSGSSHSKVSSPVHSQKVMTNNQVADDDIWGEFVSSKPKQQTLQPPKKASNYIDDDEWTDFVSSPSVKPQNGLNTISLNVHTNLNMQKATNQNKLAMKKSAIPLDVPSLNYITPKTGNHKSYNDKHFQNL